MGNAFNRILHRISIGMVETFDHLRFKHFEPVRYNIIVLNTTRRPFLDGPWHLGQLTTQVTELILWTKGPQGLSLPVIRLLKNDDRGSTC